MKDFSEMKRIVIKIGSSSLTHSGGGINFRKIDRLAMVLSDIKNMGKEVILVTSGAVSAGMSKLGMVERPKEMAEKQAAASVGQCELMFIYDKYFSEYGQTIAQLLLTKGCHHPGEPAPERLQHAGGAAALWGDPDHQRERLDRPSMRSPTATTTPSRPSPPAWWTPTC